MTGIPAFGKADFAAGLASLPAAQTVCRARLLPMELARDVTVVPTEVLPGEVPHGGPLWHNWRLVHNRRLCRGGVPVDDRAADPAGPPARHLREAVWGGTAVDQFGHFIIDHSARLVVGALARPDLPVLLGLSGRRTGNRVPGFVDAVLDWYGIARDRIETVRSPTTVGRLWVAPQPEQLGSGLPPDPWIDRQTVHAARRLPDPPRHDIVYVSRAGLPGIGGRMAGETALTDALRRIGVAAIAPEELPLVEQLGIYLGARVIVFAEGSALHALQLLGRIGAHVIVLNRRPRRRFGLEAVAPRVHALSYVEATATLLNSARLAQHGNFAFGLSVPDMSVLAKTFGALGIDLASALPGIVAARDADIAAWVSAALLFESADWRARTRLALARRLQDVGLAHIFARVREVPHET